MCWIACGDTPVCRIAPAAVSVMNALPLLPVHASLLAHERQIAATSLDSQLLSKLPLFHNLTTEQLLWVCNLFHDKTYAAGTTLIAAEEPGEIAYILLEGTAKVHVEQADGRNVILAILGPGQLIGEMSLADSLGCSATVVTLEESRVLWIGREHFQICRHMIPEINANIVYILSSRLRLANAQIQSLATLAAPGRIARQILAFAQAYGRRIEDNTLISIRLTQDDLADLVGASRVHVNRVLTDYRRRGILSVDQRHHITIHNTAELIRRSE